MSDEITTGYLGRKELLSISYLTRDVEIPDVGTVRVRELTAGERERYVGQLLKVSQKGGEIDVDMVAHRFQCLVVSWGAVDENGKAIFRDAREVERLTSRIVVPLFEAIEDLSRLNQEVEAIDEAEDFSASTPGNGSFSESPSPAGAPPDANS